VSPAAATELERLRALVLRYLAAEVAEREERRRWDIARGEISFTEDGPAAAAYDDAIDERIVAHKLLAQAVKP
jgi:hypothetical protein